MAQLTRQEEQVLLAVFDLEEQAYLITIREKVKEFTGKVFSLGTIYVPLNRLEKKGCLESRLGEPTAMRGGKAVKYYSLTQQGINILEEIRVLHERMWKKFALDLNKK